MAELSGEQDKCARVVQSGYKHKCKIKNIFWDLELSDVIELIFKKCVYCGALPSNSCTKTKENYNGIDRKNNSSGYFKENVVTCCSRCNKIKSNELSYSQMLQVGEALQKAKFDGSL